MPSARILIDPQDSKLKNASKISKLALPIIVVNLLYTVESTFSLILVSDISTAAIAAVGFSLNILWFIYSLMALSYTGTSVLVAQRVGAGKDPSPVLIIGLLISLIISIPLTLWGAELSLFMMRLLGASDNVVSLSRQYIEPIFWFISIGFLTNTYYGAFNGFGDTKTPMKVAILMNLINISTAYLLINGKFGLPKLGVAGAGWGIVLSELVAFLIYSYMFWILKKPFAGKLDIRLGILKEVVRIGLPTVLERSITSLSFNVFVGFLAKFGDKALAAHQIGIRVESISFMIGFGFMIAATTVAGQNFGAKNYRGLIYGINLTANLTAMIMGILGVLLILFPHYPVSIFSRDEEVVKLASYYLIIVGLSQVPMAYASIFSGALKGMGRTTVPMIVNISSFWGLRIIPSYLLLKLIPSPLVPWTLMTLETFLRAVIFFFAYRREIKRLRS